MPAMRPVEEELVVGVLELPFQSEVKGSRSHPAAVTIVPVRFAFEGRQSARAAGVRILSGELSYCQYAATPQQQSVAVLRDSTTETGVVISQRAAKVGWDVTFSRPLLTQAEVVVQTL